MTNTMLTCMDLSTTADTTLVGGGDLGPGAIVYYILKLYTPGNTSGENLRDGLPRSTCPNIRAVLLDKGRIFAAPSRSGLWYRDDFIVGINDDESDLSQPSPLQATMRIFPNPSSDHITISFKESIPNGNLAILNPQGRTMKCIPLARNGLSIQVDISILSQGIYFVTLTKDGYILGTKKIIKAGF